MKDVLQSMGKSDLVGLLAHASLYQDNVYADIKTVMQKGVAELGPVSAGVVPMGGLAMATPVEWKEDDRIGFLRQRKVASTTMHRFMIKAGYHYGECIFQECVYRKGPSPFSAPCKVNKNEPTYPCGHIGASLVLRNFYSEKTQRSAVLSAGPLGPDPLALRDLDAGQLHMVTVLRDPTKRVLSEYFYTQSMADEMSWAQIHPPEVQALVAQDDFEGFVRLGPNRNPSLNRQTLQLVNRQPVQLLDWPVEVDAAGAPIITNRTVNAAGRWLHTCRLVMLAEYMPQSLMLFRHIFGLGKELPEDELKAHTSHVSRKSEPSPRRAEIMGDTRLMALLQEHTWADRMLYAEAETIFFAAFKAMLESQGEVVDDIQEALRRHAAKPEDVTISTSAHFKRNMKLQKGQRQKEAQVGERRPGKTEL
jgi:hypothetical protein